MTIRSDELGRIIACIATRRPDLAHHNWAELADRLERTIALASWRTQTPRTRALALIDAADALSLAQPVLQQHRHPDRPDVPVVRTADQVARRGWTRNPVGPL